MEDLWANDTLDMKKDEEVRAPSFKRRRVSMEEKENTGEAMNNCCHKWAIFQDSKKWIKDLKAAREEMHFISVKNAILLDNLVMAGGFSEC
jgi:hypothetical protein